VWLQSLCQALEVMDVTGLFPRLDLREGEPEVAVHQALLFDVIHSLQRRRFWRSTYSLTNAGNWGGARSLAPRRSC
jgi:hypothetical protein